MNEISIFNQIEAQDLEKMLNCFQAYTKTFQTDELIMRYSHQDSTIGIILSGQAQLVKYDFDGYRSIIEHQDVNSVFTELFVRPLQNEEFEVIASQQVTALFFDYSHLIKRCTKACTYHSILTHNMLQLLSENSTYLHMRIDILSQRTLRGKLLSYFNILSQQNHSCSFTLPFPLYSLADYLFVDRSAMLREMKKLREEGLIHSRGRHITLLSDVSENHYKQ